METIDNKGKQCPCGKGSYEGTSLLDGPKAVLHCTNCRKKIPRFEEKKIVDGKS